MYLKRINGEIIGEGESLAEIIDKNKKNLERADLERADLEGADLEGADLEGANLEEASLERASLTGANLTGANLEGAYLYGANLEGANLTGADLEGAIILKRDGVDVTISRAPIQVLGLDYAVMIFDNHMKIGCELHSFEEWGNFSDDDILEMDSNKALDFWSENKSMLMEMCESRNKNEEEK